LTIQTWLRLPGISSGLSNHAAGAAASTPSAEVVQQPQYGPSSTQGSRSVSLKGALSISAGGETAHGRKGQSREFGGLSGEAAHQCPRIPDSLLGTEALLAISQGQACACSPRQHLSGVTCQSSRGDQVTGIPEGGPGTVDMGSSSVGLLEGAPPRQTLWQITSHARGCPLASGECTLR